MKNPKKNKSHKSKAKPHKHNAKPRPQAPKPRLKISLYGTHAVKAALENNERSTHVLYATENAAKDFEQYAPEIVPKEALEKSLPPGAVHQGVGLDCGPLPEIDLQDLIIKAGNAESFTLLILDQVTDPHNVGAILRSACAFGANGIIMQSKHAPELNGVLAKTACGAIEHVPVAYETNLSRSIETLQEAGFFVYGLDERGDDVGKAELPAKKVLVLGAEGPGIRRLVKEKCDGLLRLPMHGAMPSINVSNAAAVALYATQGTN